jgi:rod shape-determining protein MreD
VVLVWLAFRAETWAAVSGGFVMGFLRDGVTAGPAGGWALTMVLEALALKAVSRSVEVGRVWSPMLAVFAVVIAGCVVLYPFLMYVYTGLSPIRVIYPYFSIYCIQAVTSALISPPACRLLDRAALGRAA